MRGLALNGVLPEIATDTPIAAAEQVGGLNIPRGLTMQVFDVWLQTLSGDVHLTTLSFPFLPAEFTVFGRRFVRTAASASTGSWGLVYVFEEQP